MTKSARRVSTVTGVLGGIFLGWCLLVAVTLRSCMHQHSRPIGHGDIRLDVSPDGEMLVFNAAGDGTWDLYLLDLQSSQVRCLEATSEYEITPRFSPDGASIVYAAAIPGDRADHIFVRPTDGGAARQLTSGDANDTEPRFSPDGSRIVFVRDATYHWGGKGANWSGCGAIWTMDTDGRNQRQLMPEQIGAHNLRFVNEETLEFDAFAGVFRVPLDGSSLPDRIAPPAEHVMTVSPDGRQIAWTTGLYSGDQEIMVANADGTNSRQVTNSSLGSVEPVFSPSGDRIYFFREQWPDGPTGTPVYSLWEVLLDGTPERKLHDEILFSNPLSMSR